MHHKGTLDELKAIINKLAVLQFFRLLDMYCTVHQLQHTADHEHIVSISQELFTAGINVLLHGAANDSTCITSAIQYAEFHFHSMDLF